MFSFVTDPGIREGLRQVLLYDIDPYTGEVYDPGDPTSGAFSLSEVVSQFFSAYKFAKDIRDMYTNAVEGAKKYSDTDRIKSFLFLSAYNEKYKGTVMDADIKKVVTDTRILNNTSVSNFISYGTVNNPNLSDFENIRRLDNVDLPLHFTNSITIYSGISWETAIYKQLLLDVMDTYITHSDPFG